MKENLIYALDHFDNLDWFVAERSLILFKLMDFSDNYGDEGLQALVNAIKYLKYHFEDGDQKTLSLWYHDIKPEYDELREPKCMSYLDEVIELALK